MRALYKYRGFVWRRALTDVRHRFAGTGAGVLWNVLQPLASILLYAIVFSRLMTPHLAKLSGTFAFTLYLCAGLLPWIAFSECVSRGTNALTTNAQFLKKLAVPEYLFIAEAAVSSAIGLAISMLLLLIFALATGASPSIQWVALPIPLFCFIWLAYAFSVLSGSLRVFFPDIAHVLPVLLQIAMWTAPIVYAPGAVPQALQDIARFHPVVPAINAMHDLFLFAQWPDAETWIAMFAWPAALSVLAHLILRKLRPEIRDVI
ncbi:MAG TPA: ABC transporter permease [Planctomycetota bacterium]|nr:ABC transporter permease [Planctomycetota bacterium]